MICNTYRSGLYNMRDIMFKNVLLIGVLLVSISCFGQAHRFPVCFHHGICNCLPRRLAARKTNFKKIPSGEIGLTNQFFCKTTKSSLCRLYN